VILTEEDDLDESGNRRIGRRVRMNVRMSPMTSTALRKGASRSSRVGDKYHVHEEGEDEAMTGSKKGFTNKTDVKKFIKKNVERSE
jgi:hypothetical protein